MASSASQSLHSFKSKSTYRYSDYYDLETIIFTQIYLPTVLAIDLKETGWLDTSGEEEIRSGSKMDFPLWIAEHLAKKQIVSISIPKTHSKTVRQSLKVDAAVMPMSQNQYLYELGNVLSDLTGDAELPFTLSLSFASRFPLLWDSSRNWGDEDSTNATSHMTHSEKKLFKKGFESLKDYQLWSQQKRGGIQAAAIIASSKKRKRSIQEP